MNTILPLECQYIDIDGLLRETSFGALLARHPRTLVYFYPRDNTPGCTLESQDFTRLRPEFESLGVGLIGVSRDSVASHAKFVSSCSLGVDLVSDPDESIHRYFAVIGEKNSYGKTSVGVIRSTFLIDPSANILCEWRNVKATSHAERVLASLREGV
ncbi:MAG TPA: peroxiredoxin [bacterium]|nr:peroxiredoxin [bacterium]